MAPKELGINFLDNHFEILVIVLAVIISIVLISIVIYAVKLRTINSGNLLKFQSSINLKHSIHARTAIRSDERDDDDDPQPSTSNYQPLTPSLSCPGNLPIAGTSTSFLTVPGITRTYT